jgi:menaquinone-9 beta-reductase
MLPAQTETLIIGGGPAGLAVALSVKQRGLDVIVVDRAPMPIDKPCGEGLMPDGIAALQALGVNIGPELGMPFRGIRFLDAAVHAEAVFPDNKFGLGIRRTRLQAALAECATRAGIPLFWQTRIKRLDRLGAAFDDHIVRSRWIVGADGPHSRTREWIGAGAKMVGPRRLAVRQHFRIPPWTDFVEVYWHTHCQAYVTPTGPDEICVAVIGREQDARISRLPTFFPQLAKRLANAIPCTVERGAISTTSVMSHVSRGQVALVGDAAGPIDAVTGTGLTLAFRQAQAVASALADNNLASYGRAHRRITRMPRVMARLLLLIDKNEDLRKHAIKALSERPLLFGRLLAAHADAPPPWKLPREAFDVSLMLLSSKLKAIS